MRFVAISGIATSPFSFLVTQANAARGTHGGDGRNARLVPADAGVDDVRTRRLDGLAKLDDFVPALTAFDQIEHRQPVDDDEVCAHAARTRRTISTGSRMRFS